MKYYQIYRCYFVWDNNLWLITIPVCLLLGSIGEQLLSYASSLESRILPLISSLNSCNRYQFIRLILDSPPVYYHSDTKHRAL